MYCVIVAIDDNFFFRAAREQNVIHKDVNKNPEADNNK